MLYKFGQSLVANQIICTAAILESAYIAGCEVFNWIYTVICQSPRWKPLLSVGLYSSRASMKWLQHSLQHHSAMYGPYILSELHVSMDYCSTANTE